MDKQNTTTLSDSYIRDVTFPSGYNANQNPLKIHYVSVLSGYETGAFPEKFTYCDLGCGNGVTLNILASMFPGAEFTGIDFNQEHINHATQSAKTAEIRNVTYIKEDFTNIENLKIDQLDYICCNGTFSWVNTHIQEIIKSFVGNRLAQNGKFYVEYAAQPGKIQMDPLWHFLREMTIDSTENSVERVKLGIKYLEKLGKNNALFFKQNPVAHARVQTLSRENIASIAHNALTEWQALNHSNIARGLEKFGISFSGQADLLQNHLELHIPKIFYDDINALPTSVLRETMKDYILNRGLRRDIYIKNTGRVENYSSRFNEIVFGAGVSATQPLRKYDFGTGHTVNFNENIYKDILKILNKEPINFSNIKKNDSMKSYEEDKILQALQMLIATGYIMIFKKSAVYRKFENRKNIKISSRLIEHQLKNNLEENSILYLPSGNTGQVEHLGPVLALFLKLLIIDKSNDPVNYACEYFANKGFPINIQNKKISNKSELKKSLEIVFKVFNENILPELARLEIIN